MLLLNGYTLGFFFLKQAAHLPADAPEDASAGASTERADEPDRLPPAHAAERPEIPASLCFYRYF